MVKNIQNFLYKGRKYIKKIYEKKIPSLVRVMGF